MLRPEPRCLLWVLSAVFKSTILEVDAVVREWCHLLKGQSHHTWMSINRHFRAGSCCYMPFHYHQRCDSWYEFQCKVFSSYYMLINTSSNSLCPCVLRQTVCRILCLHLVLLSHSDDHVFYLGVSWSSNSPAMIVLYRWAMRLQVSVTSDYECISTILRCHNSSWIRFMHPDVASYGSGMWDNGSFQWPTADCCIGH